MAEIVHVRPLHEQGDLRRRDDAAVRAVFAESLVLGRPNEFLLAAGDRYASLCLDWYLTAGRTDAGLALTDDGTPLGYALVCTDGRAHAKWARTRTLGLMAAVTARLASGRLDRPSREFYRDRLADSLDLRRNHSTPPRPAHAHLNVVAGARSGRAAAVLLEHIDRRCEAAGMTGWYGEINAREGSRTKALERLGLTVVHTVPNKTLSRAVGAPVHRLTVVRDVTSRPLAQLAPTAP